MAKAVLFNTKIQIYLTVCRIIMSKILSLIGTMFSSTPNSKGKRGELKTSLILSMATNSEDYIVIDDVTLHTPDNATTQIDHIVICQKGIFVLEVKNYDGFIYGSEEQYKWTQVLNPKSKFQFLNPLIQNKKHVTTVQQILKVSDEQIFSIVVFMGKATFKTSMPENVVQLIDLNRTLRKLQTQEHFTEQQCQNFSQKIHNRMLDKGALANTVHLANIEKKRQGIKSANPSDNVEPIFGAVFPASISQPVNLSNQMTEELIVDSSQSQEDKVIAQETISSENFNQLFVSQREETIVPQTLICPRCQSNLVLRTAKKGQNQGNQFYGCSNFPKCRFILNTL
jgi:hypothetical protein